LAPFFAFTAAAASRLLVERRGGAGFVATAVAVAVAVGALVLCSRRSATSAKVLMVRSRSVVVGGVAGASAGGGFRVQLLQCVNKCRSLRLEVLMYEFSLVVEFLLFQFEESEVSRGLP
jgi:hypothetical protein